MEWMEGGTEADRGSERRMSLNMEDKGLMGTVVSGCGRT